jgi:uncharacterized protein (TIGR00369 family)
MNNRTPPDTFGTTRDELQQRIDASPFNSWLGLRIEEILPDRVEFTVPWKEEFIGSPRLSRMHGGVLAAAADAAAGYTVMAKTGTGLSTVDLRLDFHQPAGPGELRIKGTVVHQGRKISCSDVQIFDATGRLVASGRGTFYTPTVERT